MSCCDEKCQKCGVVLVIAFLALMAFGLFLSFGGLDSKPKPPVQAEKAP